MEAATTEAPTRFCLEASVEYELPQWTGTRYERCSAAQESCIQDSQDDGAYDANCDGGYYPCTSEWNTSSSSFVYERPKAPTAEAPTTEVPTTEAPTTEVPTTDVWKQMSSTSCRMDMVKV